MLVTTGMGQLTVRQEIGVCVGGECVNVREENHREERLEC